MYAAALDKEIAAVASHMNFQKVFVYDISVTPAEELAILSSPDSTGTDYFGFSLAVSREYGIVVGASKHSIGSMFTGVFRFRWIF
ncbi:MAG: hypothetical protein GY696_19760 [Gammaproteobacteria bacterium]|nr:hypothetical protein [Gammaproteobacteria bacterium]